MKTRLHIIVGRSKHEFTGRVEYAKNYMTGIRKLKMDHRLVHRGIWIARVTHHLHFDRLIDAGGCGSERSSHTKAKMDITLIRVRSGGCDHITKTIAGIVMRKRCCPGWRLC